MCSQLLKEHESHSLENGDHIFALDITGGGTSVQRACFSLLNHLIFLNYMNICCYPK